MRKVRVPLPVVAALVVFVAAVVWLLAAGLPPPKPLKRDKHGILIPDAFTSEEYARYRAEQTDHPLHSYLVLALAVGREFDALNAVSPNERRRAEEWLTRNLLDKSVHTFGSKDDATRLPFIHRLREFAPHTEEPLPSLIAACLLSRDEKYDEAEAAFAALPPEYLQKSRTGLNVWSERLAGFLRREKWREAYQKLEPKRDVFHRLGHLCHDPNRSADGEELVRMHREADPDDPLLSYHTAFLRYNQKRYADVVDATAEFKRHPPAADDRRPYLFSGADMRNLREFALAMLGREAEVEATGGQPAFAPHHRHVFGPRAQLAIALRRGDLGLAEEVLESGQQMPKDVYTDPHLAPLFLDDKFAELRAKYPPPAK